MPTPIIRRVADAQAQLIGEEKPLYLDFHVARRSQNADDLVQRNRRNNVWGHHNLSRAVEQILNPFGFNVDYVN